MRLRSVEKFATVVEHALNAPVYVSKYASESSIAVCCLLLRQLVFIQVLKWHFDAFYLRGLCFVINCLIVLLF